jgi:iron(III) transport system permease protein
MALSLARSGALPVRPRLHRPSATSLIGWLATTAIGGLVLVPIAMLVLGSFSSARLPADFAADQLTLNNYASVYSDPLTYRVLGNTVVYVCATIFFGMGIALLFAWLVARTNLPLRWLWVAGIPLGLAIPGMLESMVWVLLFSPRIGFVNRFATDVLGASGPPFDVYTLAGMIALESLRSVPTAFLLLLPLMLRFDRTLEDVAALSGARPATVLRRVSLPLLAPGILAVVLYQSISVLSSFEVPGIIGLPGRVYVFSTLIYTLTSAAASAGGSSYGMANALAMFYLVVTIVGLWVYTRATRNASRFAVVTGRGYRPRLIELGAWRWPAMAVLCVYVLLSTVLPVLVLLWSSITPLILQPTVVSLGRITARNWERLASDVDLLTTLGNTLQVVLASACLAVLASLLVAWITVRTRFRARGLLNQLAFASHGVPGTILGLALVWIWVRLDAVPIYGTVWIIVLGLATSFLALGSRSLAAGLVQIHAELEEAAYASGASPMATLRRVVVPLLLPALAGLWIWVAMLTVRAVTLPLMLQTGPASTVLGSYLWREWERGDINFVGAIGVVLVLSTFALSLALSRLGLYRFARV